MAVFNDRDDAILYYIMRYKYLDKSQIQTHIMPLYGGTSNAVYHGIRRKLKEAGFIKSIRFNNRNSRKISTLHYLTDKGAKYLVRTLDGGEHIVQQQYQKVTTPLLSERKYYHRKRMTDFRIALDKALANHSVLQEKFLLTDTRRVHKGESEKVPETKIKTADGETALIPDITVCLRSKVTEGEALFFVEIDTAKETIIGKKDPFKFGTIAHKYDSYLRILEDGNFAAYLDTEVSAFRVLTVTETQTHIEGIQRKLQHLTKYHELFLLATHEDIQQHGILNGHIWQALNPRSPKLSLENVLGIG